MLQYSRALTPSTDPWQFVCIAAPLPLILSNTRPQTNSICVANAVKTVLWIQFVNDGIRYFFLFLFYSLSWNQTLRRTLELLSLITASSSKWVFLGQSSGVLVESLVI